MALALSTYENLKSVVTSMAGRDDLSKLMDVFIGLTEDHMYNNEAQPLRLRSLEAATALVTISGANSVALPDGYMGNRSITLTAGGCDRELTYFSPSAIPKHSGSGIPSSYTIEGANIVFNVTPDSVYDIDMIAQIKADPLSSTNQTNIILTNHPTIYLYGCMSSIYDHTGELEDSEFYFNRMIRSIKGAIRNDMQASASRPQAKLRGLTP